MTTIKVAGLISANAEGKTVYKKITEVEIVASIKGRHDYAKSGEHYYEVSIEEAKKVKDGSVVAITHGGARSVLELFSRDGHMEGELAGTDIFRVTGRGKEYGGKIRLYGKPMSQVPANAITE